MKNKLPEWVIKELDNWFGEYKIVHSWLYENTFLVGIYCDESIYFVRLWQSTFTMPWQPQISIDEKYTPGEDESEDEYVE